MLVKRTVLIWGHVHIVLYHITLDLAILTEQQANWARSSGDYWRGGAIPIYVHMVMIEFSVTVTQISSQNNTRVHQSQLLKPIHIPVQSFTSCGESDQAAGLSTEMLHRDSSFLVQVQS